MGLTTPRYVLRYPVAADPDNVPSDMLNLATDLDNKIVGHSQGTLASRPAAGITGREYRATDTGIVYLDIGTSWAVKAELMPTNTPLAYNAAWPSSPIDGQIVYRYSDPLKQCVWKFKWDSTAGIGIYHWVLIGGADFILETTRTQMFKTTALSPYVVTAGVYQATPAQYLSGIAGYFDFTLVGESDTNVVFQINTSLPGGGVAAAEISSQGTLVQHRLRKLFITGGNFVVYISCVASATVNARLALVARPLCSA